MASAYYRILICPRKRGNSKVEIKDHMDTLIHCRFEICTCYGLHPYLSEHWLLTVSVGAAGAAARRGHGRAAGRGPRSSSSAVVSQYDIQTMVQIFATPQGRDLGAPVTSHRHAATRRWCHPCDCSKHRRYLAHARSPPDTGSAAFNSRQNTLWLIQNQIEGFTHASGHNRIIIDSGLKRCRLR